MAVSHSFVFACSNSGISQSGWWCPVLSLRVSSSLSYLPVWLTVSESLAVSNSCVSPCRYSCVCQSGWWCPALRLSRIHFFPVKKIHLFPTLADGVRLFGCFELICVPFIIIHLYPAERNNNSEIGKQINFYNAISPGSGVTVFLHMCQEGNVRFEDNLIIIGVFFLLHPKSSVRFQDSHDVCDHKLNMRRRYRSLGSSLNSVLFSIGAMDWSHIVIQERVDDTSKYRSVTN